MTVCVLSGCGMCVWHIRGVLLSCIHCFSLLFVFICVLYAIFINISCDSSCCSVVVAVVVLHNLKCHSLFWAVYFENMLLRTQNLMLTIYMYVCLQFVFFVLHFCFGVNLLLSLDYFHFQYFT